MDPLVRWWSKIDQSGDCWLWTAGVDTDGYGQFKVEGRNRKAHRWGFEQLVRPLAPGEMVLHTCDTPGCCRPDHWYAGDHQQNMRDLQARRRRAGERNHRAKVSAVQVEEIRKRYAFGGVSQQTLADEYGITQTVVSKIIRHVTWT